MKLFQLYSFKTVHVHLCQNQELGVDDSHQSYVKSS